MNYAWLALKTNQFRLYACDHILTVAERHLLYTLGKFICDFQCDFLLLLGMNE